MAGIGRAPTMPMQEYALEECNRMITASLTGVFQ